MKTLLVLKFLTFAFLVDTQEEDKSWLKSWAHLSKYSHDDYDPFSANNNFVENNFEYNSYHEEDPQCCDTNENDALYNDKNFAADNFGGKTYINDVDKNVDDETLVDDSLVDKNSVDKPFLDENLVNEIDLRQSSIHYDNIDDDDDEVVETNEYFKPNSDWEFGSKSPPRNEQKRRRKRIKSGWNFFKNVLYFLASLFKWFG